MAPRILGPGFVAVPVWHKLLARPTELRLESTLENGQCFGWTRQKCDDPVWVGVLGQQLLALRQTESDCLFRCLSSLKVSESGERASEGSSSTDDLRDELRSYFQLGTPLAPLYEKWAQADGRMATVASTLPGMRVVRQEPVECLFSFICSSNNNIGRIGGMLETPLKRHTFSKVCSTVALYIANVLGH